MIFENEAAFDAALVEQLTTNYGWESQVLLYKTEEELIQNWKQILFENNRSIDRLNDVPLTDSEMSQVLDKVNKLETPLSLNGFINGKTVSIKRDNPDDPLHLGQDVSLKIYDRREIAAGQSRYQIAQQPKFKAKNALLPNRRGDLILLINGMPLIHCELKRSGVDVSQACYQIEKYAHEGVFTGLFSLVQIFVAMSPDDAVYFANPGPNGVFNRDFFFHWADFNNQPMHNWKDVAKHLLSIPMAHQLIGFYTIADKNDNLLKVMRSYQYFAASNISNRVAKRDWSEPDMLGGYVWHTTGSGKTLTSFKSAQLIADSGDADKVVFLIDRIELGTQSFLDYCGFADESIAVQATANTKELVAKLKSDDIYDTLIVTSIQKMSRIEEESGYNLKDIEEIQSKRIVFIIDEAHRSVFGEMRNTIKDTFPLAMFFGFTGTPIHEENQKKMSTTTDIFGDELHRYSIADGIRDKNVLGFDPYMVSTFKERELRQAVALDKAKASSESDVWDDPKKKEVYLTYMQQLPMAGYTLPDGTYQKGIEDELPNTQYTTPEHQGAVVDDILNGWTTLSQNGKFHAIFATSSISEAIQYYRLFKEKGGLKVTALFDTSIDNKGGAIDKEDALLEIFEDYNALYGKSFSLATSDFFKKDVSYRLAHKNPYQGITNHPEQQIDLLIVVDQMLTGFDSKWVNTLYLDKVLQFEKLIQAFSRTNRLFGPDKPFGTIRYYRKPYTMEKNIEEAFALYSGDRPYGLFAEKLEHNIQKLKEIYSEIAFVFNAAGVANFEKLPDDSAECGKFAKLFKEFNKYLEAAKVQGFNWDMLSSGDPMLEDAQHGPELNENKFLILALRYKELFSSKKSSSGDKDDLPYEIDAYLTEIRTDSIDADYMESRFKKFCKALQDGEETDAVLTELHRSFSALNQEDQKTAMLFLTDVQSGNIEVDKDMLLRDYINAYQSNALNNYVGRIAEGLGCDQTLLLHLKNGYNPKDIKWDMEFDNLIKSIDRAKAKPFLEDELNISIKPFEFNMKLTNFLKNLASQ